MSQKKGKGTQAKKRYATHVTALNGERVYVSAKSQEELDRKVAQMKLEMGAGVDISDNTTFEEYARLWLETYKKPPRIRESSYVTLSHHLDHDVIPSFKGLTLREVKPMHIQKFLADIGGYSYPVQSKCLQMVRNILRSAEDNGLILKSPVRSSDKAGGARPKEKEALTNEQAQMLLDAVKGTRAYLFCLLALTTGMRKGEILGLMWEDIDFKTGHINVTHNKALVSRIADCEVTTLLKTDASRRRLPMPLLLRHTLEQEQKCSNSPYVLAMDNGNSLSRGSFKSLWDIVAVRSISSGKPLGHVGATRKTGEKFTVTLDFHCHPHLLRHTYITQLFESGLDVKQVQYLAGHSTPDMTLKVYTHYRRKSREQETAQKVEAAVEYLANGTEGQSNVVSFKRKR